MLAYESESKLFIQVHKELAVAGQVRSKVGLVVEFAVGICKKVLRLSIDYW